MSIRYDYYNAGDNAGQLFYADHWWLAQTFTTSEAHTIGSVKLKLYRLGTPGTITVSIRATSGGLPTGEDLCSGTTDGDTLPTGAEAEWREINLGALEVSSGATYAIVIRTGGDASNYAIWRYDGQEPAYPSGKAAHSATSGVTWIDSEVWGTVLDYMFENWGLPTSSEDSSSVDHTIMGHKVSLEAIRNIEIVYGGRAYIGKSGNFVYESRYHRNV